MPLREKNRIDEEEKKSTECLIDVFSDREKPNELICQNLLDSTVRLSNQDNVQDRNYTESNDGSNCLPLVRNYPQAIEQLPLWISEETKLSNNQQ